MKRTSFSAKQAKRASLSRSFVGRYPTKKRILDDGPLHSKKEIKKLFHWKMIAWGGWSKTPNGVKIKMLRLLIATFLPRYYIHEADEWAAEIFSLEKNKLGIIHIGEPLSVISCLHEIGHGLYGASELDACRFSVHLFKEAFPQAYDKLVWKGHMLVKKRK